MTILQIYTYKKRDVMRQFQRLKSLFLIPLLMLSEEDVKEHLSRAYVYAVATKAGFAFQPIDIDRDSIDVQIKAHGRVNEASKITSPQIELQLKATTNCVLDSHGSNFRLSIPIKNYNDLRSNRATPAILVVLFLPDNPDDWIIHSEDNLISKKCAYWVSLKDEPDVPNTSNITISVPKSNVFSPGSLTGLMSQISITGDI